MYHYEDLLKAEQKDLECNLASLLEPSTRVCVQSGPKRAKQALILSSLWKLCPLPDISDTTPHLYSPRFSLHSFVCLLPISVDFCFAVDELVY